jgi:membrane-bound lytic murein transglycosylase B
MRPPVKTVGPMLVLALSACGTGTQATLTVASPAPHPSAIATPAPTVAPAPVAAAVDASYVANELGGVEQAIRLASTPDTEYLSLGIRQQKTYHLLAAHPEWVPAVLAAVPTSVRSAIQNNLTAAQQIGTLNGTSSKLPHWKIIAPPTPDTLLAYYREAQQAYGVAWQYLAAINLIETNMGRIQGLSSAGAQGPMQFMPATWASYGRGDVNNPRDAILAAGRYLQVHGAPQNMTRAIYAYNPSMLYVRAVQLYAQEMVANARTFYAYYNWQVYVPTDNGDVLLPEGFSN